MHPELLLLIGISLSLGFTPGPNNAVAAYSGFNFGIKKTLPLILGVGFGYTTLIECKLETGRTHQIRAHFKFIGHPLFNDEEYGGDRILKGTTFTKYKQFVHNCFKICDRQALHAKSLGFAHPTTCLLYTSPSPRD